MDYKSVGKNLGTIVLVSLPLLSACAIKSEELDRTPHASAEIYNADGSTKHTLGQKREDLVDGLPGECHREGPIYTDKIQREDGSYIKTDIAKVRCGNNKEVYYFWKNPDKENEYILDLKGPK